MSIITDIEDGIVAALATESITAYAYEAQDLDQLPLATMMITETQPGYIEGVDQIFGVGSITWMLRYYVAITSEKAAQDDIKTAILSIHKALGADVTEGITGLIHLDIGSGRLAPFMGKQTPELVYEVPITATLESNTGE